MTTQPMQAPQTEKQDKMTSYEVNGNEVKLSMNFVRMNLVSGDNNAQNSVTESELTNFIMLAKHNRLDPFLKECYLVKFAGRPAQMIVSKEAFMKRAESNENYEGFEAGVILLRNNEIVEQKGSFFLSDDKIVGGWAKVYRKDRKKPIESQISMQEFSKGQATWKNMPATMIRKTAIVNALREAFPQSLGAMYTEDDRALDDKTPASEEVGQAKAENLVNKFKKKNVKQEERKAEVVEGEVVTSEQTNNDSVDEQNVHEDSDELDTEEINLLGEEYDSNTD
ncbi:phage recombination protein Bet [Periweissella ghanensis]|uniref:Phage recombination protein Bet n=1 Tax=Periweissella ghanensis TaxID=467997 RepID=A0ABN8BT06_9LACO|nr:phage recombination protein Bet [Periweissella ghanensis]CAH0419389.1 hypothetical protein WGH24286_01839 [Periweissella ghanensis]